MQVILDTGCRTAVAGAIWHRNFQEKLNQRQLPYFPVKRQETFRFGAGEPVIPPFAGSGWRVRNTASDCRVERCPALVGPSEMAR